MFGQFWSQFTNHVTDFFDQVGHEPCMHLVEISIFSLNNVTALSVLPKLWTDPIKIGHILRKYSTYFKNQHWNMTLKIRILQCSWRLFVILASLTVTLFSEKLPISNICICGFMPNSIKKSVTVSTLSAQCIGLYWVFVAPLKFDV